MNPTTPVATYPAGANTAAKYTAVVTVFAHRTTAPAVARPAAAMANGVNGPSGLQAWLFTHNQNPTIGRSVAAHNAQLARFRVTSHLSASRRRYLTPTTSNPNWTTTKPG
jgi:hypothetical protein